MQAKLYLVIYIVLDEILQNWEFSMTYDKGAVFYKLNLSVIQGRDIILHLGAFKVENC